jgi:hypothetical protein
MSDFFEGLPFPIPVPKPAKRRQETFGHDAYAAMPKGAIRAAWFRVFRGVPACYLLEIDTKAGRAKRWDRVVASFDSTLAAGTLVTGVVITHQGRRFFSVLDIQVYAGRQVEHLRRSERMTCIRAMLRRTSSANHSPLFLTFGLPPTAASRKQASALVPSLPYDVGWLHGVRDIDTSLGTIISYNPPRAPVSSGRCVFLVTAMRDQDIYTLSTSDGDSSRTACVQTLEDSARLNRLFRHVRETEDPDEQEISEDDERFEDVSPERYLSGGPVSMECMYSSRFKKWAPVSASAEPLSSHEQALGIERGAAT